MKNKNPHGLYVSAATFSSCGKYRYTLLRFWDASKPRVVCIGLNPSTTNAQQNDNTIHTLIRVLKRLGYGGVIMMNLFAWISPNPDDLLEVEDPLGDNDTRLRAMAATGFDVIFCWGSFQQATERIGQVEPIFGDTRCLCFGHNKNGTPFHPRALIYRKGALDNPQLIPYDSRGKI